MRKRSSHKASAFALTFFLLSQKAGAESLSDAFTLIEQKCEQILSYLSYEKITDTISSNLFSSISQMRAYFFVCLCTLTVCIVFSSLKNSFLQSENLFDIFSISILISALANPVYLCFSQVQESIESLCAYMTAFIPTAVALQSASGCTLTSAVTSAYAPFAISCLESISISVILPLTRGLCSVIFINSLCKKTDFSGLCSLLKSTCLWLTGLSFTILTGVLSIKSLLQSGLDSITVKGLKYGAARLVPIAGSLLSESMRSVIESISLVKSISGFAGIVFILYSIIPPLCKILTLKFFLWVLSAFAKCTANESICKICDSLCSVTSILLALLIGACISFIIMFTLFIKTNVTI